MKDKYIAFIPIIGFILFLRDKLDIYDEMDNFWYGFPFLMIHAIPVALLIILLIFKIAT